MFLYLLTFIRGFTRKKMPNLGTIVEVRTDETVNYCFFSFLLIYFCKQLIAFNCKDAFLQSAEIYSSNSTCYQLLLLIVQLILLYWL